MDNTKCTSELHDEEIIELGEPLGYISGDHVFPEETVYSDEFIPIDALLLAQMLSMGIIPYPLEMPVRSPSQRSARTFSRRARSPYTPYTPVRNRSRERDSPRSQYSDEKQYTEPFYSDDERDDNSWGTRKPTGTYTKREKTKPPMNKSKVVVPNWRSTKQGNKRGGRKLGVNSSTPRNTQSVGDVVTRRMLSARRLKINELKNEIDLLVKELEEIRQENKLLKRDNVIQNKQLDKYQDKEGDLSQLIDSHNQEVRALKEQIRKWKEKNERINKSLKSVEEQLDNSQRKVKKLQDLSENKRLGEREDLSRQLQKAEQELEEKSNKLQQLEKHVELLEKTHKREVISEMKRHAATKLELQEVQAELDKTKVRLRDREKELEARNIYFSRVSQAQGKISAASVLAIEPPSGERPSDDSPDLSPRRFPQQEPKPEKKKVTKPTEVDTKKQSVVHHTETTSRVAQNQDINRISKDSKVSHDEPKPVNTQLEKEDSWEAITRAQKLISQKVSQTNSLDEAPRSLNHRGQKENERISLKELKENEDEERKQLQMRAEEEKKKQLEKQKQIKEEKERVAREERERLEREEQRKLREAQEVREKEERLRREAEERERRSKQEAEERAKQAREQERLRIEMDSREAEERKKKDMLLKMMKDIDTGKGGNDFTTAKPVFGLNSQTKRSDDIDSFFLTSGDNANNQSKKNKEYAFREPDENLFNGLPSHKQGSGRPRNHLEGEKKKTNNLFAVNEKDSLFIDKDDMDFGGYQPTVLGATEKSSPFKKPKALQNDTWKVQESNETPNKKTNALDDIFGTSQADVRKSSKLTDVNDNDIFGKASPKSRPLRSDKQFPWESESSNKAAPDKILPLRPRADNSAIHSKPTVRAIHDLDDDIEEVTL